MATIKKGSLCCLFINIKKGNPLFFFAYDVDLFFTFPGDFDFN